VSSNWDKSKSFDVARAAVIHNGPEPVTVNVSHPKHVAGEEAPTHKLLFLWYRVHGEERPQGERGIRRVETSERLFHRCFSSLLLQQRGQVRKGVCAHDALGHLRLLLFPILTLGALLDRRLLNCLDALLEWPSGAELGHPCPGERLERAVLFNDQP